MSDDNEQNGAYVAGHFQLGKGWVGGSRQRTTRAEWAKLRSKMVKTSVPTRCLATGADFRDDDLVYLVIGNGTPLGMNFELPWSTVQALGLRDAAIQAGRRLQELARKMRAVQVEMRAFVPWIMERDHERDSWKWWEAVDVDYDLDTAGPFIPREPTPAS